MAKRNNKWISLYVFILPPFEHILVNCIEPLASFLVKKGVVKKWFFIRYFENGSHIRLRLQLKNPSYKVEVSQLIKRKIEHFIEINNIERSNLNGEFVSIKDYLQETERYGGTLGIEMAESIFCESSKTVCEIIIQEYSKLSYEDAMKYSVILNYILLYNLFLGEKKELENFLMFSYLRWLPISFTRKINNYADYQANKCKVIKEIAESNFNIVHNKLQKNKAINNSIYFKWHEFTLNFSNRMRQSESQKKISYTPKYDHLWKIYDSYIHMSNNRIGLNNEDEIVSTWVLLNLIKEH